MENENTKVIVSDLGLASLLVTLGYKLVELKRIDEKRIGFLFLEERDIHGIMSEFWSDIEISVSTQSLFNNQKVLKNRLYTFK